VVPRRFGADQFYSRSLILLTQMDQLSPQHHLDIDMSDLHDNNDGGVDGGDEGGEGREEVRRMEIEKRREEVGRELREYVSSKLGLPLHRIWTTSIPPTSTTTSPPSSYAPITLMATEEGEEEEMGRSVCHLGDVREVLVKSMTDQDSSFHWGHMFPHNR